MRPSVEMLDQATLHGDADREHHGNREQDRDRDGVVDQESAKVSKPILNQRRADLDRLAPRGKFGGIDRNRFDRNQVSECHCAEAAQHEQGAVREVNNSERAENERQAECNERICAALIQPIEELGEKRFHGVPQKRISNGPIESEKSHPARQTGPGETSCQH